MSARQGYVMKFPDGRVVSDAGNHDSDGKWFKWMRQAYGVQITWGPPAGRKPAKTAKAAT